MESGRKLRAAGEILRLGGVDYRLESVEGLSLIHISEPTRPY